MTPCCMHKCCASTAHRKNEAPNIPHVEVSPFFLNGSPELCLILWAIRPVINGSLELGPEVLNWIHIRRFWGPGTKNRNVVCCQPASGSVCSMSGSIVVLKWHLSVMLVYKRYQRRLECFSYISSSCNVSVESDNIAFSICTYCSPYHNAAFRAIMMNILLVKPFILFSVTPFSWVFLINDKTFFVRKNHVWPLLLGPSSVTSCPCQSSCPGKEITHNNLLWATSCDTSFSFEFIFYCWE